MILRFLYFVRVRHLLLLATVGIPRKMNERLLSHEVSIIQFEQLPWHLMTFHHQGPMQPMTLYPQHLWQPMTLHQRLPSTLLTFHHQRLAPIVVAVVHVPSKRWLLYRPKLLSLAFVQVHPTHAFELGHLLQPSSCQSSPGQCKHMARALRHELMSYQSYSDNWIPA